jgi:N-acetylglucosamine-6-phosphate deacetylase
MIPSMLTSLHAASALTAKGEIFDAVVLIEDGRILRAGAADEFEVPEDTQRHSFPEATLVPAYLDVHIHGSAGHDVMENSADGERAMSAFLARHGVGGFLATTVTASVDRTLAALDRIANWIEATPETGAKPLGIHLEGPFISHARRGVHPPAQIQPPDIALFDRFYDAARGHVRLMTLAPEIPGALDLLRHAISRGVRISIGHSDALAVQARAGIDAGATSSTHAFNAMRGFEHREPGLLGVVLDDQNLFAEIICDGHHVAPEAIRLYARSKPHDRRILITDAISAAGEGDGKFRLGELEVTVADGRAMHDGKLAGSVLTMDRGVEHFLAATGLPVSHAAHAAGRNPAAMLGLDSRDLAAGARADINIVAPNGRLLATFLGGQRVG